MTQWLDIGTVELRRVYYVIQINILSVMIRQKIL